MNCMQGYTNLVELDNLLILCCNSLMKTVYFVVVDNVVVLRYRDKVGVDCALE